MKHIITILVLGTLGYFGYVSYQNAQEPQQPATGVITNTYNNINETLDNTRAVTATVGVTQQDLINAGVEDLMDTSEDSSRVDETSTTIEAPKVGTYTDYNNNDFTKIDGKIVLDFYAPWCPSCRKLEKDIKKSLMDIPANVTILKVDYDSETGLKNKYGVTRQHTLVQVDQNAKMFKRWSGGSTLESILEELE